MTARDLAAIEADAPLLAVAGVDMAVAGRTLLTALNLEVRAGERWCVLGPNGAGKTSLLRILAGIAPPERGEIRLRGQPYARWEARAAAMHRALLTQGESYAFRSSVRDCVLLGRHPHVGRFGWPDARDHERVRSALAVMDLLPLADRDVQTLSGGEQQRTRLAALLAQDPELFLLDEPTTHLDLGHQAALFTHLTTLSERQGRAVVFATHELGLAVRFATHALVLCGDRRTRAGRSAEILREELLSAVFGFPVEAAETAGGRVFVPRW